MFDGNFIGQPPGTKSIALHPEWFCQKSCAAVFSHEVQKTNRMLRMQIICATESVCSVISVQDDRRVGRAFLRQIDLSTDGSGRIKQISPDQPERIKSQRALAAWLEDIRPEALRYSTWERIHHHGCFARQLRFVGCQSYRACAMTQDSRLNGEIVPCTQIAIPTGVIHQSKRWFL